LILSAGVVINFAMDVDPLGIMTPIIIVQLDRNGMAS